MKVLTLFDKLLPLKQNRLKMYCWEQMNQIDINIQLLKFQKVLENETQRVSQRRKRCLSPLTRSQTALWIHSISAGWQMNLTLGLTESK